MEAVQRSLPHLRKTERSSQLYVKNEPFLMLAAELHNSTWSNPGYMSTIWPDMKARHINTLLGSVTWEMIEPVEGKFNFSELDQIILAARKHGFHLVLLWFGAYKNALSSYAPQWVRKDAKRFPRIRIRGSDGTLKSIEALQPFPGETRDADAKAFANLMRHLKEIDSRDNTVLMVQIENEIGLMGDSRDRSSTADDLINREVPQDLLRHLKTSWDSLHPMLRAKFPDVVQQLDTAGPLTWTQAFGGGEWTDDIFMADALSRFVQHVAAAGRREYDIPLYLNVALCSEDPSWADVDQIPEGVPEGDRPGLFPSGGPVGHNLDVYMFNAPDIAFYAPDIYLQDYEKASECFAWGNMPLFIPEQRRDAYGVRRIWAALANNLSIGCSPFGIDSLPVEECSLPLHYKLLAKLSSRILEAQAERPDDMFGFFFDELEESKTERTWAKNIGNYKVTVERALVFGRPSAAAGMIIRQRDDSYLLAGYGYQVTFESLDPRSTFTGILTAEEKDVDSSGNLFAIRVLNGDETSHHKLVTMPSQKPDYGGFPIPCLMPATTMIVSCRPYSLVD